MRDGRVALQSGPERVNITRGGSRMTATNRSGRSIIEQTMEDAGDLMSGDTR